MEKLRILLVEDVPSDAELVEHEIRKAGIKFIAERVEAKAAYLNAIKEFNPDLILSDYSLPTFDGLSALRLSRKLVPGTPFILVTGSINEETAVECMKAGATDYILKDHLTRLGPAIKKAVAQRRLEEAKERAEENLRESMALYKVLFESSNDGILLLKESHIVDCNPRALSMFGCERQDILHRSPGDFSAGQHVDWIELTAIAAGNKRKRSWAGPKLFEWAYHRSDGARRESEVFLDRIVWYGQTLIQMVVRDITERKQMDEALRNSEEQYRLLFSNNPQPLLVFDRESLAFLAVNDAMIAHYGYSREEFLHMTIKDIRPAEDIPAMLEVVAKRTTPYHNIGVWRHRKKDGTLIDVEITRHDVRFNNKDAVFVRLNDVTERRQAALALEKNKQLLSETARMGRVGGWEFDIRTKEQTWTEEVYRIHEVDLAFKPTVDSGINFYTAASRPVIEQAVQRAIEHGEHFDLDLEIITAKGNPRWVHALGNADLEHQRVVGFFQDVTERKQAEEEYLTIIKTTLDGFWIVDAHGRFLDVNDAYCRMIGYTRQELLTMSIPDIEAEEKPKETAEHIQKLMAAGYDRFETRHVCKGGKVIDVEVTTTFQHIKDGRFYVFLRDITDRIQAERQLKSAHTSLKRALKFNEALLSAVPTPVFYKDAEGRYLGCNSAFTDLMGVSSHQIVGKTVQELWPGKLADVYHGKDLELMQNPEPQVYESRICDKKGLEREVIFAKNVFRNENDQVAGIVGAFMDITERKNAEEMMRASEQRFRQLWEKAPVAYQSLDKDARIIEVNDAWLKQFGYESSEVLGHPIFEFLIPAHVNLLMEGLPRYLQTGEVHDAEFTFRHKNGGTVDVSIEGRVGRDAEGGFRQTHCMLHNITERKRAELVVRESEERFRSLITKVSNIAIQGYGPDGTVRFWNKASEDLYGYSAEEAMGRNLIDLIIPPEMRPAVADAIRKMVEIGEGHPAEELLLMRKDGSRVPVYSNHTVVDIKGRGKELFCIDIDLSDRKRAEEDSARLHQQVESILDAAGEGIFGLNADGVHTFVNPAAAKMLGYTVEELIGQHSHKVWHSVRLDGTPYPPEECPIYETLNDGTIHHGEEVFIRKDGTSFLVDFFSAPILDSGKTTGAVVTFRDITKRKHAEAELRASEERYKDLFESNPAPMWVSDKSTLSFLAVNEAAVIHYGYTREEFLSMTIHDIHPPEVHRALSETVAKNTDTLRRAGVWRHRKKDGTLIDVEITTHDLTFNGRSCRLVLANDVSDHMKAETALKESEDRYRSLVEHSPDGIAIHAEGKIVFVNAAARALLNATSSEQVVGMSMLDLVHPDYREIVKQRSRKALEERGVSPLIEEKLLRLDGTSVEVEIATIPFTYQNKPAVQVVARDITTRKLAEQALRDSEAQNRAIVNAVPDLLFRVNKDGVIVDYRAPDTSDLYISPDVFLGKNMKDVLPPDVARPALQVLEKALASKTMKMFEYELPAKGGGSRHYEDRIVPLSDDEVLSVIRDITERKNAESSLLKLKKAVDTSGEAVFLTDKNGVFTYINPAFTSLYGYTEEEIVNKATPRILKSGRLEPQVYIDFWKTLLSGKEVRGELVNKRKDGTQVNIETSSSPILDDEGKTIGFLGIQRDITKRKQVEYEIRLLAQGIASIKDCVSITDLDDRFIFVNKAFEDVYGYTSSEVTGKHISMLRPNEMPKSDVIRPATLKGGWYGEIINRRKGGADFPVELWTSVVKDETGKPVAMVGVARDITERLKSERVLRASEARYRSVLTSATDAIITVDKDGVIVGWNNGAERIFGYRYTEAIGQPLNNLVPERSRANQRNFFRDLLSEGKGNARSIVDMDGLRKDGAEFSFELSLSEWETDEGLFYTGVIRDVSERKKAEQSMLNLERQLFQSQKIESLGTLAGGIAHDFNNILGIILGHSSLLRRVGSDPERLAKSIQSIESATRRGASLVSQILTFARKSEVMIAPMSLNESIDELTRLIEETFPKTIILSVALDRDIPAIEGDRTQMHQTLLNLCVNARDAMPDGGTILISTTRVNGKGLQARLAGITAGEFVCVTVADTGTGMDEETKRRIFEPFFTTKEVGKGTGLGLALVHGIVSSHHGYVDVESSPGEGTSFRLYFPVPDLKDEIHIAHDEEDEDVPGGNETLLLVEDEEALRQLLQSLLEVKGYTVMTAVDGESAMKLFEQHHSKIAAVLTDLGLPKMDGGKLFLQMKRIHPGAKVIVASGYIDPVMKTDLMNAGIKSFIHKPYIPNAVLKQIRSVLDLPDKA